MPLRLYDTAGGASLMGFAGLRQARATYGLELPHIVQ